MVILIEITVGNRLKWIVADFTAICRKDFYISIFCEVKQSIFPFSIVSMLLMHTSPASLHCS